MESVSVVASAVSFVNNNGLYKGLVELSFVWGEASVAVVSSTSHFLDNFVLVTVFVLIALWLVTIDITFHAQVGFMDTEMKTIASSVVVVTRVNDFVILGVAEMRCHAVVSVGAIAVISVLTLVLNSFSVVVGDVVVFVGMKAVRHAVVVTFPGAGRTDNCCR